MERRAQRYMVRFIWSDAMPLVVVSGLPSSGKTRRVGQLVEFIKTSHGKDAQVKDRVVLG